MGIFPHTRTAKNRHLPIFMGFVVLFILNIFVILIPDLGAFEVVYCVFRRLSPRSSIMGEICAGTEKHT